MTPLKPEKDSIEGNEGVNNIFLRASKAFVFSLKEKLYLQQESGSNFLLVIQFKNISCADPRKIFTPELEIIISFQNFVVFTL